MNTVALENTAIGGKSVLFLSFFITGAGFLYFVFQALGTHPERVWFIFLINFLLFTGLSMGGLLFSTIMHFVGAKWSHRLSGIAEAFSFFFPVSLLLFLIIFLGRQYLFLWIIEDLHGKEVWLNIPFLMTRDLIALLILYILGFVYLYHSLWLRLNQSSEPSFLNRLVYKSWKSQPPDPNLIRKRLTIFAGWYMFAFAMVLSLIGYDLVMSMDPHWYSTLFGPYTFIKAVYAGIGALIILLAILHLSSSNPFSLTTKQFRDMSSLFFGFCLVWGDFFYSQFIVIWYGNISEETSYIIERTMTHPWSYLAWAVFVMCFILPFIVLLNGRIKESPVSMIIICSLVIVGFWMEHFLLLGPVYLHDIDQFPLGVHEIIISAGFLGLFILSILFYLKQFPELLGNKEVEEV
jgi:Ni/Fe-hydrogenase subunit HybB-like protein